MWGLKAHENLEFKMLLILICLFSFSLESELYFSNYSTDFYKCDYEKFNQYDSEQSIKWTIWNLKINKFNSWKKLILYKMISKFSSKKPWFYSCDEWIFIMMRRMMIIWIMMIMMMQIGSHFWNSIFFHSLFQTQNKIVARTN